MLLTVGQFLGYEAGLGMERLCSLSGFMCFFCLGWLVDYVREVESFN
jgi:hypothetical protein